MSTIEQLHYLQSVEGTALLRQIRELDPQPNSGLAVIAKLRTSFPPEMVAAGMSMHQLRQRAGDKFAHADEMWFTRPGLEQATSESIASWRVRRFGNARRIADLCCGIGGDSIALAQLPSIEQLTIADRDPVHLEMAEPNVRLHMPDAPLRTHLGPVEKLDLTEFDAVFIDPARRDDQGRHATGKTEPPLDWCIGIADKVPTVGIKLAPGLPHHLIPADWGFETIALGSDLKESVLWSPALRPDTFQATVIDANGASTLTQHPGNPVGIAEPRTGNWLYDPNPAITRAGLVDDLARVIDARKIDDQIGFLVAELPTETPFARCFRILASQPWHEKNLRQTIVDLDGGEVVIRRRGLAGNVEDIQRRIRGSGIRSLFVAMTRLEDRPWAIVCDNAAFRDTR